ncbi:unnamed protein product [Rotaria sordida]|uniref:UAS domain-containing protein n=2 Tax=Rotaria sordida TaxID=392033 RepID=A0A815PKV6_9BILA|nr:unnamed protein product [Rotaria sordida]
MANDDDDDDGSDISNYDIDLIDHSPFPNDCQNEVQGIEFLCQYFMHRYNACPTFLIGSLEEACQEAFSSIIIKERRPVLVYIHHDKNLLTNRFCWNILCSEMIIDYLLENYIVWPWDITFESNRNILIKIWNKIFPSQTSIDFSLEQCPMLIGIMRESLYKKDSSSTSEYEFTVLFKNETLTSTEETFSLKSILNELSIFKEECDDNEQALSFDLIKKTNLSWEVIIEICKYLSLNDAINAFSSNILFFLRKLKAKVHIDDLSETFINTILRKIKSNEIISLRLNSDESKLYMISNYLSLFNNVISLNLVNLEIMQQISEYEIYFPKLTCLSLCYNNEIGFNLLQNVLSYLPKSIRRFEIHCAGVLCTHYDIDEFNIESIYNFNIEYFLLDIGQFQLTSANECYQHYESCFLNTIYDLIQWMRRIQCFRLIINKYNVKKLLQVDHWKNFLYKCNSLNKITLQVIGGILENDEIQEKVRELQLEFYCIRPAIKFQIVYM